MAVPENRVPQNINGKYFVDSSCIDCDTCRCISSVHFRRSPEAGYSYVCKQPESADEIDLVEEAIQCCPVGAIGSSTGNETTEALCCVNAAVR
jgi:ferredoxin